MKAFDIVTIEEARSLRYLRLAAVGEMLGGASRRYVEYLIEDKKLRAFRPSKKMVLVPLEDVIAYVESQPVAQEATA